MDAETLTEPERRIALLDWLARGRDVRIAAELCGEKHDWAKAVAQAAGHPDRDQIRQALAAAKAELHPPRQLLKPDTVAPTRPLRAALVEHVASYADPAPVAPPPAVPVPDVPQECQHQPRLALENRLWHAVCDACGTTWHRTLCTAPGCGAFVSAEYIARTGSTRHDWHPKEQS